MLNNGTMKKNVLIFANVIFLLFSCSNETKKVEATENNQKDTLTAAVKEIKPEIKKSLTDSEALKLIKEFIKKNPAKFKDLGEVEDYDVKAGDYNGDGVNDFYFTVNFYPGGDFIYPQNFYYNSEKEQITDLKVSNGSDMIFNVEVLKMDKDIMHGAVVVWTAFSGEDSFMETVKCDFKIIGNKIIIEPAFLKAIKRAEKKVNDESEKAQAEMMEESQEEVNY